MCFVVHRCNGLPDNHVDVMSDLLFLFEWHSRDLQLPLSNWVHVLNVVSVPESWLSAMSLGAPNCAAPPDTLMMREVPTLPLPAHARHIHQLRH